MDHSADETGIGLGEEIDLHSHVDRDHGRIAGDARRVIDDLGPYHLQAGVGVGPLVELGRAKQKRRLNGSSQIERTGPLEGENAIADHFGPDTQVTSSDELICGDIRDLSDAELQCGTVIGKASDLLADSQVCLVNCVGDGAVGRRSSTSTAKSIQSTESSPSPNV